MEKFYPAAVALAALLGGCEADPKIPEIAVGIIGIKRGSLSTPDQKIQKAMRCVRIELAGTDVEIGPDCPIFKIHLLF